MIDRSKCKMMSVWGGDKPETPENNNCLVVDANHEEEFYNGGLFEVEWWGNCE